MAIGERAGRGAYRFRDFVRAHPRSGTVVRAALAAALAWAVVRTFTDAYPYYAPLGAVIAVSTTVADSLRGVAQAAAALVLAAALSAVVILLPVPTVVGLGIVVGLGTLVAGWWRLGDMGSWVPIGGMFMLVLGGEDPAYFMLAYVGLTFIGGVIGLAMNLVFPPLPLAPVVRAQTRLRGEIADVLEHLATTLEREELIVTENWRGRQRRLRPQLEQVRRWAATVDESQQVNWRARRWRRSTGYRQEQARSMEALADLVDDMTTLLARSPVPGEDDPLGPELRLPTAQALRAMSGLVRAGDIHREASDDEVVAHHRQVQETWAATARLRRRIERVARDGRDVLTASTVASILLRALETLEPTPEMAERLESAEVDEPAPGAPAEDGELLPTDARGEQAEADGREEHEPRHS